MTLSKSRNAYIRDVRAVLRARRERCAPACKGWFVDGDRALPVRCDECAALNGYARRVLDEDIQALPEAWKAVGEEHGRGRGDDPDAPSKREQRAIDWIAAQRSTATRGASVALVAHVFELNPEYIAHRVRKIRGVP